MVVEGHRAVVLEAAGARLADVVHERREARHDVRAAAGQPVLQVDGLLENMTEPGNNTGCTPPDFNAAIPCPSVFSSDLPLWLSIRPPVLPRLILS